MGGTCAQVRHLGSKTAKVHKCAGWEHTSAKVGPAGPRSGANLLPSGLPSIPQRPHTKIETHKVNPTLGPALGAFPGILLRFSHVSRVLHPEYVGLLLLLGTTTWTLWRCTAGASPLGDQGHDRNAVLEVVAVRRRRHRHATQDNLHLDGQRH